MNTSKTGNLGPGDYQEKGVGNSSGSNAVDATNDPNSGISAGRTSQGESKGVGSSFSAILVERPNVSNTRNLGPSRAPSPVGRSQIPVVTMDSRKTGKK